ncbi:MAG: alpha/beta fold hydrolase, partial [Aeromonas sp.]
LIDHRGQGRSDRLLSDPHKGYVAAFSDYVTDLKQLQREVIAPDQPTKLFLLAHSMGGAISAHYLAHWPEDVTAAVLSSPMFGIALGGVPKALARAIVRAQATLGARWGKSPYGPGKGPYQAKPFAENDLTHSAVRYSAFRALYAAEPELQLGGPTAHWINQAFSAAEAAVDHAGQLRTPLLVLQAGDDQVVDNAAQTRFCQQQGCRVQVIAGARHELFIEQDRLRTPALTAVLDFFAQH